MNEDDMLLIYFCIQCTLYKLHKFLLIFYIESINIAVECVRLIEWD